MSLFGLAGYTQLLVGLVIPKAIRNLWRFHVISLRTLSQFSQQIQVCFCTQEGIPYWTGLVVVFGLCATWCDYGVNRPMLSEVVAPQHRARQGNRLGEQVSSF